MEKAVLILKSIHTVLKSDHGEDEKMTNVIQESFVLVEMYAFDNVI
jgi:hypothetical protein